MDAISYRMPLVVGKNKTTKYMKIAPANETLMLLNIAKGLIFVK